MDKTKKPHRWKPTYNPETILKVFSPGEELKTATIKKRLSELNPAYEKPTKEWYRKALLKLWLTYGYVEKVKKEDEIADYWRITEEGKKKEQEK